MSDDTGLATETGTLHEYCISLGPLGSISAANLSAFHSTGLRLLSGAQAWPIDDATIVTGRLNHRMQNDNLYSSNSDPHTRQNPISGYT